MDSIKNIFQIGPGPSSSHTIGPYKMCLSFLNDLKKNKRIEEILSIEVVLYGSLALTGKGHFTDKIILKTLLENSNLNKNQIKINFNIKNFNIPHPNTLEIIANFKDCVFNKTYFSLGGGVISDSLENKKGNNLYEFTNFNDIKLYLKENKELTLINLIDKIEGKDLNLYLNDILNQMFLTIENGLKKEGHLQGKLKLNRVAKGIYEKSKVIKNDAEKIPLILTSFAYSTSEENADGEKVVTAPTCGSSGILPACLYYEYKYNKVSKEKLINALKIAGIIGNIIKENASVSGAVHGCQAEVGAASSMASAALAFINDLNLYQIEYASEIAMEHFLGLTCDPVLGYVQIPCIERNGIGVLRAYSSYLYAKNIAPLRKNKVSFDDVIKAMKNTGESLSSEYKETAIGGLAKIIK